MRIHAVLMSIMILLSPCAAVAVGQPTTGASQESPVPLALSVSLGETAGNILLRAHQYDVNAIVRVIAGYSYGIGGFHKDSSLAKAWLKPLLLLGAMKEYAVSALCIDLNEGRLSKNVGRSLAHCKMAVTSTSAAEFRQLGLFDTEKICRELEADKRDNKKWKNEYKEALNVYGTVKRETSKVSATLRELCHRAATPEEQYSIDATLNSIPLPILSFYIATKNDHEKKNQEWRPEYLCSFIFFQREVLSGEKIPKGFLSLVSFSAAMLREYIVIQDNKEKNIALLHDAHKGNLSAMRTVAGNYMHGASGFPQDTQLAQAWFQSGAIEGDATSMLLVAMSYFEIGHLAPAWAFVKIIEDLDCSDVRSKTMAGQLKRTIESTPGKEKIQQEGENMVMDFFDRSEERMKWRLQHMDM
jgi:TPR repeat protein